MNILFQNDYFPEEQAIWEKYGAKVIHGLCPEKIIKEFSPVVARGTIAFDRSVKQSLKYNGWPNIMWPFENDWKVYNYDYLMNCSDLLNYDAKITCGYDSDLDIILIQIMEKGPRWVRSNSGSKLFSGGVFDEKSFRNEMNYIRRDDMHNDISYVSSSPKKINKEWRCVIINHEVISSSQYMNDGEPEIRSYKETPKEVIKFAEYWVKKHMLMFPDSYTLDICDIGGWVDHSNGGWEYDLKIVEVNNLTTSGYYECDIERIVNVIVNQLEQI